MKLCLPNKVYLLRGANELGSGTSNALIQECTRKFGPENGALVAAVFGEIFTKLPIAVVIDENILCTHSGIPSVPRLEAALMKLPVEMPCLLRDSPLAYGIVTRYPKGNQAEGKSASPASPKSPKSLKSGRSKSKLGGNVCQKLFGGKVGDFCFHQDFKSYSKKKSPKSINKGSVKGALSKSPKSSKVGIAMKSAPVKVKSVKPVKKSKTPISHRLRKEKKAVLKQVASKSKKFSMRSRWKTGVPFKTVRTL